MSEKVKILVVDDEPSMRLTLSEILIGKGYDVETVEDGVHALEAVQKTKFRLILIDVKMPGMSGIEAYEKIKKIDPTVAVIVMTGFALENELKHAIREGAFSVVYKPLDMDHLLGLIKETQENRVFVLVVDDDANDHAAVMEIMSKKGYSVVRVDSQESCLQHLHEKKFNMVIIDKHVFGFDSLGLIKKVKDIQPDVGIVRVTSSSSSDWIEQAMKDGSLTLVRKPIDPAVLLMSIDDCLTDHPDF